MSEFAADLDAERAVLSTCMIDRIAVALVSDLDPADMYDMRHRRVLAAVHALFSRGECVEPISVHSEIQAACPGVDNGGLKFLVTLSSSAGSSLAFPHYLSSIRRYARLRRAALLATQGVRHLGCGELDMAEDALGRCAGAVASVDARFVVQRFDAAADGVLEALAAAQTSREIRRGLRTGFDAIDGVTFGARGFHKGDMVILAGRPAMGKSALALNIAYSVAKHGEPVLYACSEMSVHDMTERLLAMVAGVDYGRLKAGTVSDHERSLLLDARMEIDGIPLHLYDKGAVTVPDLLAKCREEGVKGGRAMAMLVVDHINRMGCDVKHGGESAEYARVSHNYQALQAVAMNESMCVLCLAQLNRGLESRSDKRPLMSDLRASGRAEEEAAVVLCLYREHVYQPDADETHAELIYRKHRGGKLGTIELHWQGDQQRFTQRAPDHR